MPALIRNITPDKISTGNLLLWLKPESLSSYSNGASITLWNDSSGNGFNATTFSTCPNPTYSTNVLTGGQGVSYGSALFTGTGIVLTSTALGISITGGVPNTNFSLFVVSYTTGSSGGFCTGIYKVSTGTSFDWIVDWRVGTRMILSNGSNNVTNCPIYNNITSNSSWNKWITNSFVVQSSNSVTAWTNSVPSVASSVISSYGHTNNNLLLGIYDSANGSNHYSGYLMEIIMYNTALSNTQRQDVENYLRFKYQI